MKMEMSEVLTSKELDDILSELEQEFFENSKNTTEPPGTQH